MLVDCALLTRIAGRSTYTELSRALVIGQHDTTCRTFQKIDLHIKSATCTYRCVCACGWVVQTTLLEPPYGRCRNDVDASYRQSVCSRGCQTDYLVSRCNCRLSYMTGTSRARTMHPSHVSTASAAAAALQSSVDLGVHLCNVLAIITVCVKVAKSTFLVKNKRTKWAELSRYYLYNCFVR